MSDGDILKWIKAFSNKNGVVVGPTGDTAIASGIIQQPTITVNNNMEVIIGDGIANFFDNVEFKGKVKQLSIPGGNLGVLTNKQVNYISTSYNAGTPIYNMSTTSTSNLSNTLPVYTIGRIGSSWVLLDLDKMGLSPASKMAKSLLRLSRFNILAGFNITVNGSRNVTVSAGAFDFGVTEINITDLASATAGTMKRVEYVDGDFNLTDTTTLNNTKYSNGTNLVDATVGKYIVSWMFVSPNNPSNNDPKIIEVLGGGQYDTLEQAKNANMPAIPPVISETCPFIGRIIIKTGENTTQLIEKWSNSKFNVTPSTSHKGLADVEGGSSDHKYHSDQLINSDSNVTFSSTTLKDSIVNNKAYKLGVESSDLYLSDTTSSDKYKVAMNNKINNFTTTQQFTGIEINSLKWGGIDVSTPLTMNDGLSYLDNKGQWSNIPTYTGATSLSDGVIGLVPHATIEQKDYAFFGDGTFKSVPNLEINNTWIGQNHFVDDKFRVKKNATNTAGVEFNCDNINDYNVAIFTFPSTGGTLAKTTDIPGLATTTTNGMMSSSDKLKLDNSDFKKVTTTQRLSLIVSGKDFITVFDTDLNKVLIGRYINSTTTWFEHDSTYEYISTAPSTPSNGQELKTTLSFYSWNSAGSYWSYLYPVNDGCPVGQIQAFDTRYATPSARWVQCNGQTITDANSVYNTRAVPNLNGEKAVISGTSTSGELNTFVGSNTHTNTQSEMAQHGHTASDSGHQHGLNTAGGTGAAFTPVAGLNGASTAIGYANISIGQTGSSTAYDFRQRTYLSYYYIKIK